MQDELEAHTFACLCVSAFLVGVPICLFWYNSWLGDMYGWAFWLIFPVSGVVGFVPVSRWFRPSLVLVGVYVAAGVGYAVFKPKPAQTQTTQAEAGLRTS